MSGLTLHYIYDPLCGWCYGAAPLVRAARAVPGLALALHGGGMLTGANRRRITAQWRDYVMPHDRRIAALTGQPFGERYFEGLLRDESAVMDSAAPTTTILAAQALGGVQAAADLLARLQHAHYVDGLRIADAQVLADLAGQAGLDPQRFAGLCLDIGGDKTQAHMAASRALLNRLGGHGFPTFALQKGTDQFAVLDVGPFLGDAGAWQESLARAVAQQGASMEADGQDGAGGPVCGAQGCALPAQG
ncbi:DsbA family protein [Cupriavidus basilensis]|uniref:Thioredoxin-like protein n=1 Tax=Cupriavidus basilensis TaxID=68895 RepID=A0A0C4YRD6_9BURK|nr:DsbA family protein [Cupriavidus basilensis]AJG23136.1 Thioredoxin-like protein [Cupriavidus basilensis]